MIVGCQQRSPNAGTPKRCLSSAERGSYGALLTDPWVVFEAIRERTPPDS